MFAGGQAYKLIMEYVPLGSLKEYLPRHKKGTSLNTLLNYSMQICKVRLVLVALLAKEQTVVGKQVSPRPGADHIENITSQSCLPNVWFIWPSTLLAPEAQH